MRTRQLGHTGLHVSVLSLGTWLTYGNAVDDAVGTDCLDAALEAGVNFIDTADVYNTGGAERFLGEFLSTRERKHVILATKAYFPMGKHPLDRGLSYRHLFNACQDSLERLQTEYIDLYQCHRYDEHTPLEETCFGMHQMIQNGWILHWGVSQWTAVQILQAIRVCEKNNWRKPVSNQPIYNLLNRSLEQDVMEVCEKEGLGLVVYSPLAQGILTGKYTQGNIPTDSRAANPELNQYFSHKRLTESTFAQLDQLKLIADRLGIKLSQLALAWAIRFPAVTSAILGATSLQQLQENLAAEAIVLDENMIAEIETILGNAPVDQYTGTPTGYGVKRPLAV
jgi:voltage-dependent potassium channel beta subunit